MAAVQQPPEAAGSLLDHLEEIRTRIFWVAGAALVGTGIGFLLVQRYRAMDLLVSPLREAYGEGFRLTYLSPTDPFFITIKLAAILGLLIASPVALYHLRAFLAKRVKQGVGRAIVPMLLLAILLFAAGVSLAYFVAIPMSLSFLLGFQAMYLEGVMEVRATLGFMLSMMVAFGVVFELPVVVMLLSSLGIVNPDFLRKKRRHAFVIALLVASLLSPGDVLVVTFLLMAPLVVLYEASILLSVLIVRRRDGAEEEAPTPEAEVAGSAS